MSLTFYASNVVRVIGFNLRRSVSVFYCRFYKLFYNLLIIQILYSTYFSLVAAIIGRKKLEWKTYWQSPICRDILKRKSIIARSKTSFLWALFYFSIFIILTFDLSTMNFLSFFFDYSDTVWYLELLCTLVVFFNACIAVWFYAWGIFTKPMPVSPIQLKLFGIKKSDPGFCLKDYPDTPESYKENKSFCSSFQSGQSSGFSVTPLNYSAGSWGNSLSGYLDSTASSWSFHFSNPHMYVSTPKTKQKDNFSNKYMSRPIEESLSIKNNKQLDEFLKQYEEDDKKIKSMYYEDSVRNLSSLESSPLSVLSKSRYQKACRLPNVDTVENDLSETHYGDVLYKLKITENMLMSWCEKLRKWISQTILVKLVEEIEEINTSLCRMSLPEYQIGTVNLFTLHQIAATKFQHLKTVSVILPYLDMHFNQEYMVHRLKDLAKGGCLSEFKWNSGGSYGDKPWCDDLPTDSAIVLHVFCCYLDSFLPPEPHFPGGKPFSSKYFKKTPEKLAPSKDTCFIYQSSIVPPHFKVVIDQDIYSLPKGRNNLFHAFLILFHHLKTKESSMLGKVNLGPSGLNLLWVID